MNSRQFAALWHILLAIAYGVLGEKALCGSTIERAREWYKVWTTELEAKS
jgi:hypothetical protein